MHESHIILLHFLHEQVCVVGSFTVRDDDFRSDQKRKVKLQLGDVEGKSGGGKYSLIGFQSRLFLHGYKEIHQCPVRNAHSFWLAS